MNQITITAPSVNEAINSALTKLNTTEDEVDVKIIDQGKKGFFGMGSRLAVVKVSLKEQSALKILDGLSERKSEKPTEPIKLEKAELPAHEKVSKLENQTKEEEIVQLSKGVQVSPETIRELSEMAHPEEAIEKTKQFLSDIAKEMNVQVEIESNFDGRICTINMRGEHIAILIGKRGQVLNSLQYLAQLVANRYTDQFIKIQLDAEGYRARRNETLTHLAHKMADKAVYTHREVALEPMPSYERKMIHAALSGKKKVKTYSTGTDPYRHIVIAPAK